MSRTLDYRSMYSIKHEVLKTTRNYRAIISDLYNFVIEYST